jgi:3-oxoacyl-[acyl-carrier protein] reductase
MELGLEGRVCVVTGGTSGIGAATARMLGAEGAQALTVARSDADIELDVTARDAGERLLAACPEVPWALVNSAGTAQTRTIEELSDEDWNEQWELHVMASMRLMKALAPAMTEAGGGRIVNVVSSSGRRPSQTLDAAYSVTKAAQLSLSRVFAERWAGEGVLVNAVLPGVTETPLWLAEGGLADQVARRTGQTRDEVIEATHAKSLTGHMARSEEIAAAVVFLCSEQAANVVGAAWSVDGGAAQSIF